MLVGVMICSLAWPIEWGDRMVSVPGYIAPCPPMIMYVCVHILALIKP